MTRIVPLAVDDRFLSFLPLSHITERSVSHFGLEELRRNCPCAECRGLRELGQIVGPKPRSLLKFTAVDAELIGGWGLTITWSDGHSTGIFAWSILRAWQTPTEPGATPDSATR